MKKQMRRDLRRGFRLVSLVAFVAAAFMVLTAIVVVGYSRYVASEVPDAASESEAEQALSPEDQGVAVLEVAECAADVACENNAEAINVMATMAGSSSLIYTPLTKSSPGELQEDGTRAASLAGLKDDELVQVADAINRDGAAGSGGVVSRGITVVTDTTLTYEVPASDGVPALTATMVFAGPPSNDSIAPLVSVTYEEHS